jgi:hypothetical protein
MKTTLDSIVREWLFESGNTEHKYPRALSLALGCLRTLNLDVSGTPVAKLLKVNSNDTVDLPQDYISLVTLGIYDAGGKVRPLYPSFTKGKDVVIDECGGIVSPKGANSTEVIYWETNDHAHYNFGQVTGGFFGLGGGQNENGYYKVNEERGYISLEGYNGGSTIYIEYLSDLSRVDGQFSVHQYIIDTVKSYISWKMVENNFNVALNQKEVLRRNYILEKKKSIARFKSFTKDEMLQSFRKGNKLSPKF